MVLYKTFIYLFLLLLYLIASLAPDEPIWAKQAVGAFLVT